MLNLLLITFKMILYKMYKLNLFRLYNYIILIINQSNMKLRKIKMDKLFIKI
jgi:hypothetical protein